MIKLSSILKEIEAEVEWRVPNNTPDEVIDALHLLIAVITNKEEDYKDYISVIHPMEQVWAIKHGLREDYALIYDTEKKKWMYSVDGVYFNVTSKEMLVKIIKNWL